MAKYKTGTIYSGRAKVRMIDHEGVRYETLTIDGAADEKLFDKVLREKYDYEDGAHFLQTKRTTPVVKVGSHYRVLMSDLIDCPSFEITDKSDEQ